MDYERAMFGMKISDARAMEAGLLFPWGWELPRFQFFFSNMAPSGKFMEQWGETEIKKIYQILSIGEYHYTHLVFGIGKQTP